MPITDAENQMLAGLSRDELMKLWVLIQRAKAELSRGMHPSVVDDLARAVPTKLCQEIVADLRTVSEPGWFKPPEKPLEEVLKPTGPKSEELKREPGWAGPSKLGQRSMAQSQIFDEMVAALVGGPNDTSKLR